MTSRRRRWAPRAAVLLGGLLAARTAIGAGAPVAGEPVAAERAAAEQVADEEAAALELQFGRKVVTPTKTERETGDSPFAVTRLEGEDLRLLGALDVADALRTVPGVFVMDVGPGDRNLAFRGLARQFDERVVYMIDGRYASFETFGFVLWPLVGVPLPLVSRIEVLRGPGSAVHGQNALTGVVQVITLSPEELLGERDVRLDAQLRGGEAVAGLTVLGAGRGPAGSSYRAALDLDRLSASDDEVGADAERLHASLRWDLPLASGTDLRLEAGGARARHRFLGTSAPFLLDPVDAVYAHAAIDRETKHRRASATLSFHRMTPDIVSLAERLPAAAVLISPDAPPRIVFPDADGDGLAADGDGVPDTVPYPRLGQAVSGHLNILDAEVLGTRRGAAHDLTGGASARLVEGGAGALLDDFTQVVAGAFVEDEVHPVRSLSATLGLRFDFNSKVDARFTPRAGLVYRPREALALRLSAGTSFRDPGGFDLGLRAPGGVPLLVETPSGIVPIPPGTPADAAFPGSPANPAVATLGDPELRPETLRAVDAGLRARVGAVELDVAAFAQRLRDGIRIDPATFRKANQIDADALGLEAAVWVRLGTWLRGTLSYTRQETFERHPDDIAVGTPAHLASGALVVSLGDLVLAPSFAYRSAVSYDLPPPLTFASPTVVASGPGFDVLDPATSGRVPSRTRWDARLTWRPRGEVEVAVTARNLLGDRTPDFPPRLDGDVLGAALGQRTPRLIFGTLELSY